MNVPREKISAALFTLIQNNVGNLVTTCTRQPKIWTEINSAEKPWLCLFKGGPNTEEASQKQAIGLTKWTISYNLWLVLEADTSGVNLVETQLNNIADAIDAALAGGYPGQRQSLGGLVTNAWIDGGSEWGREFDDNNIVVAYRILVVTGV